MSKAFRFKQFSIEQSQCAMKIGTDSILLGSWADTNINKGVGLDIGAGTGILSLMLAQRFSNIHMEAIEIDPLASDQCFSNFQKYPWCDRLTCYNSSLDEFIIELQKKYDFIVCNPPFYTENYRSNDQRRDVARFQDAMPFDRLIAAAAHLLSPSGCFNIIIPYKQEANFIALASQSSLHPYKILRYRGMPYTTIKRSLIQFDFYNRAIEIAELIVENDRHHYTEDFSNLTKDFYLHM